MVAILGWEDGAVADIACSVEDERLEIPNAHHAWSGEDTCGGWDLLVVG